MQKILFIISLFISSQAFAMGADLSVSGVKISAQGANALEARAAAIEDGEAKALQILFDRITSQEQRTRLPIFDQTQRARLISGISLHNEKIGANSYEADLTVTFHKQAVGSVLRNNDIEYIENRRPPVLILPILYAEGQKLLWEDYNNWKIAFQELQQRPNVAPIVLPYGDLEDMAVANVESIIRADINVLDALKRRYNVTEIVIAEAYLGRETITVNIRNIGKLETKSSLTSVNEGTSQKINLLIAAGKVSDSLNQQWLAAENTPAEEVRGDEIRVLVPFNNIREWAAIRNKLSEVENVLEITTDAMTSNQADIRVKLGVNPNDLIPKLQLRGLNLIKEGDFWTLRQI